MRVLWTPRAAADLDEAVTYISRDKPDAAAGVASRIFERLMSLETTPEIGRPGVVKGTLELPFPPWQYIAVYRITRDAIKILRIRHTSRRYP